MTWGEKNLANPYESPEQFGLEHVGEIQWGPVSYDFDLTAVFYRAEGNKFFLVDDSGCSCPSPFESTRVSDLGPALTLDEAKADLDIRNKESYTDENGVYQYRTGPAEDQKDFIDIYERMIALARGRK